MGGVRELKIKDIKIYLSPCNKKFLIQLYSEMMLQKKATQNNANFKMTPQII